MAIACFGFSPNLWSALAFLALAGLGDTVSEILRRTLLQHYTPGRLHGRVGSLWLAQATAAPSAGNLEAGLAARALGSPTGVELDQTGLQVVRPRGCPAGMGF